MKITATGIIVGAWLAVAPLVSLAAGLPAPFRGSSTLQADGIVKSIDQAKQSLTVLDAQGGQGSITVADVRNLAQIRPGSKVHIRMVRNAVVRVTHGAEGAGKLAQAATRDTVQSVTAQVTAVDRTAGVLELTGATGSVFHIQGREPAAVANVTPGMQVSVTYEPQVSVAVAPAQ
jgi:type IV secretory pathway VirJ component